MKLLPRWLPACLGTAALAGCAVVPAASPPAHPSGATRTGTGVTGTPPPSSGTPKQRAVAAAGLGGGAAGENLLDEVNHVTGLHWKIPTASAP
jgi:hypothetical protein